MFFFISGFSSVQIDKTTGKNLAQTEVEKKHWVDVEKVAT